MPPLRDGNAVDFLVDGEEMFSQMGQAIRKAERTISLTQLLFEATFVAEFDGGPPPAPAPPRASVVEELGAAARRGVEVRILLNQNAVVPDSVDEIRDALATHAPAAIVRGFPMSGHALHAKLLVVDGDEAFVIGPPFERRFWDTTAHLPMDPRRATDRPLHDVSLRVRGPVVADVAALFADLWNRDAAADGAEPLPAARAPPAAGRERAAFARTLPEDLLPGLPDGVQEILEGYRGAIRAARRWVYLETQYFTSPSIVAELQAAMARGVDAILVLNEDVDIPTYIPWQRRRLRELGHPDEPRLGVFTLWSPVERPDGMRARPIYVHSKVGIVDDSWCTVGCANLDSISLEAADEFILRIPANVEANLLLPEPALARRLRGRLWSEVAGVAFAGPEPAGGWLAAWRAQARRNLAALAQAAEPASRILAYEPPTDRIERTESRGP